MNVDEQTDGQRDGRTDGWMDGLMDLLFCLMSKEIPFENIDEQKGTG